MKHRWQFINASEAIISMSLFFINNKCENGLIIKNNNNNNNNDNVPHIAMERGHPAEIIFHFLDFSYY